MRAWGQAFQPGRTGKGRLGQAGKPGPTKNYLIRVSSVFHPWLSFLLCVSVSLWFNSAARADWPHLRGPNYDGVSAERGLADAWPAEGPPRLWTFDLGQGYSGFVVGAGRLYTQRQTLGGQYLLCLDPDTGAILWEHRYDWAWQPRGAYPGPYATPTWHAGRVFYASTSGLVGVPVYRGSSLQRAA